MNSQVLRASATDGDLDAIMYFIIEGNEVCVYTDSPSSCLFSTSKF